MKFSLEFIVASGKKKVNKLSDKHYTRSGKGKGKKKRKGSED